jgi:hypothetical protein
VETPTLLGPLEKTNLNRWTPHVEGEVNLRPTVGRPVCLGVGPPSGAHDQIFITVRHLRSSCWGAPSLTRGRVCNLLLQFAVTLQSKSRRTHDILLSHLRSYFTVSYETPPTWRARSLYLYPPGTKCPSYTPRALCSLFVAPDDSQDYCGSILIRLHTGWQPMKLKLIYNRQSVGLCPGVRRPSGTRDQFFFLLETSFRQLRVCYFVAPSLTRWRVCNLLYNCFWAWAEVPQNSRPYFSVSSDIPQPGGPGPVFISHRNRMMKPTAGYLPLASTAGWKPSPQDINV